MSAAISNKPSRKKRKPGPKGKSSMIEELPVSVQAKRRFLTANELAKLDFSQCTDTERRFVCEYIRDFNGVRAYQRALDRPIKYGSAAVLASNTIKKIYIKSLIQQAQELMDRKVEVTIQKTVRECARIAYSDPRDHFHPDGSAKQIHELGDDEAAAISHVKLADAKDVEAGYLPGQIKEFKFWSKDSALDKLGKYQGILAERHEVSGSIQHDHRHLHAHLNWDDMPVELLRKLKGEVDARRQLLTDESKPSQEQP